MQDNEVGALAILCIFGLPIAAWILFRIFGFLERMEMIKRGIVPPPSGGRRAWRDWQRQQQQQAGGWAAGAWQQQSQAQPKAPPQPATVVYSPDDDVQSALFKGIRLTLIGLAILIGLSFIGGTPGTSDFRGGPWLLGGLIPMFVGIAQVIIALLSGAQLPGVTGPARFVQPPPSAGPPPPGFSQPPPASGSAPWAQPGRPPFEELSKPIQPPDVR